MLEFQTEKLPSIADGELTRQVSLLLTAELELPHPIIAQRLPLITSEDTQGDDITVQICEVDSSGNPTTTCTALTAPNSFARGLLSFNAPTNPPLVVQGNLTKYMVVIKSPGGDSVRIDATWGDGFDYAARDSGWSMINRNQIKISNAWRDVSGKRIRVAILGTINPSAG